MRSKSTSIVLLSLLMITVVSFSGIVLWASAPIPQELPPTHIIEYHYHLHETLVVEVIVECDHFVEEHPWFNEAFITRVIWTESEFNPSAFNRRSGATGLFQITPIAVAEYNRFNRPHLTMNQMWDPYYNEIVGRWLLEYYYERIIANGLTPTPDLLYVTFNAGITCGIRHYRTHYSRGIHPNGTPYRSLARFQRSVNIIP